MSFTICLLVLSSFLVGSFGEETTKETPTVNYAGISSYIPSSMGNMFGGGSSQPQSSSQQQQQYGTPGANAQTQMSGQTSQQRQYGQNGGFDQNSQVGLGSNGGYGANDQMGGQYGNQLGGQYGSQAGGLLNQGQGQYGSQTGGGLLGQGGYGAGTQLGGTSLGANLGNMSPQQQQQQMQQQQGMIANQQTAAPGEKIFQTPQQWFQDFTQRLARVNRQIPQMTMDVVVANNKRRAQALVGQIEAVNLQATRYFQANRGAAFMVGQENRLNGLGRFMLPMSWKTVKCGVGSAQYDCGEPLR